MGREDQYTRRTVEKKETSEGGKRYLEAADGGVVGVALQHHLDILHGLLAHRPGTGYLIGHLLCSLLQLLGHRTITHTVAAASSSSREEETKIIQVAQFDVVRFQMPGLKINTLLLMCAVTFRLNVTSNKTILSAASYH